MSTTTMSLKQPYFRTVRQLLDGTYESDGNGRYVRHLAYAKAPEHYTRAYLLLQQDLLELFAYIEPAAQNLNSYSYRTHELLMRACVEVEANCTAILLENGYTKGGDLNMDDYKKIEQSHRLSGYQICIPTWHGAGQFRAPFAEWRTGGALPWYRAYNKSKHDRQLNFDKATFENMLDAVLGCLVILSSQFLANSFDGRAEHISMEGPRNGFESALGDYFRVKYPDNWEVTERYGFDWQKTGCLIDPFVRYSY